MERSSEIHPVLTPYYNVEPADGAHNGRTFETWALCYMISFKSTDLLCWCKNWLYKSCLGYIGDYTTQWPAAPLTSTQVESPKPSDMGIIENHKDPY